MRRQETTTRKEGVAYALVETFEQRGIVIHNVDGCTELALEEVIELAALQQSIAYITHSCSCKIGSCLI